MDDSHDIPGYAVNAVRAIRDAFVGNDNKAWCVIQDPNILYASSCDDQEATSRAAQRLRDVAEALTEAADYLDAAATPDAITERAEWGCD